MQKRASLTAGHVARLRAAHQLLEDGAIFSDPLAVPILGESADAICREVSERPELRALRLFVAVRSRFAEDSLAGAVERGVRQAVILGAGLDTFGLRNPHADNGLRVIEVDHPATQAWKRERLDKAKLSVPEALSFASVDFERQALFDGLCGAGFKRELPAFFMWLGVVPYLSRDAVFATLYSISALADVEVVFDYAEPAEAYPAARRAGFEAMAARVAALGEPWLSFFDPAKLRSELAPLGFSEIEDLDPREIAIRYFGELVPPVNTAGPHVIRVRKPAS
ncbi:methyltransferase, TIGR00027 family [Rhizobiales bacterium GAS188]|nr:methyltransferase, TIGR00027 family [Rhizobiales bacterium GAS188]